MHEPEKWGYVYFSDKEVGAKDIFDIPKDEHLKWYMFSNFRRLLSAEDDFDKVKAQIKSNSKKILGESIALEFEEHDSGWNIWTISPFTGKKLIIKEDGKFIIQENK